MRHDRLNGQALGGPANGGRHITLPAEPPSPANNLLWAEEAQALETCWRTDPRWQGVTRPYTAEKVLRLRGTMKIAHTVADAMSRKLWNLLRTEPCVHALGALTGNQAVQMAQAGLRAIYLSGWQVAADNNQAASMYPDQSLYPSNSVPTVVRRINKALQRADQIQLLRGSDRVDFWAPIVADAEAGFGGPLNAYELMLQLVEEGVAGVHYEDQLASAKKCGHMGGKVLIPTFEFIRKLTVRAPGGRRGRSAGRAGRSHGCRGRPIAHERLRRARQALLHRRRTEEGYFRVRAGIDLAVARAVAYAPYADVLWCETSKPDLQSARKFAEGVKKVYPDKLLAYNCSPSFNWRKNLDETTIARFQKELAALGYRFQFVTLAGFHALNYSMWELARGYRDRQMAAYTELQEKEFAGERLGYGAVTHQAFVGAGYFDEIAGLCGEAELQALRGSTEEQQFNEKVAA